MVLINLVYFWEFFFVCSNMMPINFGIKFRKSQIVDENQLKIEA